MTKENKRQKFSAENQKAAKNKTMVLSGLIGAFFVILVAGFFLFYSPNNAPVSAHGGTYVVDEKPSYRGQMIPMSDIEYVQEPEGIVLSLQEVEAKKFVYFEHEQEDRALPLSVFVAPNGRVVAAVSVCEPCGSNRFTIADDDLVCNACTTRWDLNTLKGKMGACMNYPPDELPYVVDGDRLIIDAEAANNWNTRDYS
ncbi:Fe-S-containing protein [Heliorestis convoluta]|uniref:Membrane protein n=1 Tax=Heliorestis convoluta TaxID=356322 RepID=A0A5Q2MZJ5_9FIRM|nr:Fe-S-containing protein [Heliorestis convoluta]QGG47451.1 Putative membrane protein [Heliorestis convoluta]